MSMPVVFVQYIHQMGASIRVYDDIPEDMVVRLSADAENGGGQGLDEGSALMDAFYKTHGYGREIGQGDYSTTPKWTMIMNKCAVFCLKQIH